MINVTKSYLPKKEKYIQYVNRIYENGWITNNGPLVKELEERLKTFLGVKNLVLVANGTVALEIAYRALGITGQAITTPFSFVATTSSLVSNGIEPKFADIDMKSFNLDPKNIESIISEDVSSIVPVHVFGNPCDVEEISKIAEKYNLKVIYDAAHAFNVQYKNESILNFGNISTLSFHATKLFHTIEGGALIINDDELVEKVRYLINFGIENQETIPELGTNAKMNEFEAAMGLCNLDEIEGIIEKRRKVANRYEQELKGLFTFQEQDTLSSKNYSYYPIVSESEKAIKKIEAKLNSQNIYPRRYFYNSLDELPYIKDKQFCPNSRDLSKRIICLPLYASLLESEQSKIISLVKESL